MPDTKTVRLAYGEAGLDVTVPADTVVLAPRHAPGLPDESAAIRDALAQPINAPPLRDCVKPTDRVAIVHTDITRATPNDRILPVLLGVLEDAGVPTGQITLINALGTHRRQTPDELRAMLGARVVDRYRCIQHDAWDDANLVSLGTTSLGHPVRVNRTFMEADVKILTGFIEPHLFAGFSGGPKGVLPSIAGVESVFSNHGADMVGHPRATWGVLDGNPIWQEMAEAARMADPTFLLNVALNRDKRITAVFAGELFAAHAAGCAFVRDASMAPVPEPFDVIVTGNSGYPLDQSLYQSVKGMSAAAEVIRDGGAIVMAAECRDGIPGHGEYARLLREAGSPEKILEMVESPGFSCHDQWQVQVQARIQQKASVYVYADGLTDDQITAALFKPAGALNELLARLTAPNGNPRPPRVCVLPEGPMVIPCLENGDWLAAQKK